MSVYWILETLTISNILKIELEFWTKLSKFWPAGVKISRPAGLKQWPLWETTVWKVSGHPSWIRYGAVQNRKNQTINFGCRFNRKEKGFSNQNHRIGIDQVIIFGICVEIEVETERALSECTILGGSLCSGLNWETDLLLEILLRNKTWLTILLTTCWEVN